MYILQNSAATQLSCIVFYLVTTLLLIFHKMCLWKNFENRSTIWSGQKCAAKLTFLAILYVPSSGSGQAEAECRAAWNWKQMHFTTSWQFLQTLVVYFNYTNLCCSSIKSFLHSQLCNHCSFAHCPSSWKIISPSTSTVAIWLQQWSILCQTRLSRYFVIFDIWALWRSRLSVRVSRCQKLQMTA